MLYRACGDGLIRRCVPNKEISSIISHCHDMPCGGHASDDETMTKILEASFYWPTLFKDVHTYARGYDRCQRTENWSRRNEMSPSYVLEVEIFNVCGVHFIGLILSPRGNKYILVAVDYVSK